MIENNSSRIKIKGYQDGLLISQDHQDWDAFQEEFITLIRERENFFKGAKISINAGNFEIHAAELGKFRDTLSDKGISLRAVVSSSETTKTTAEMLGLETSLEKKKPAKKENEKHPAETGYEAVLIKRTLRSGMSVQSEKNVIILGDVNPGAEIVSSQNIIIWGKMKGSAYAGKEGSQEAFVCALSMAPTLLRIGNIVSDVSVKLKKSRPYIAKITHGSIQFEPWE